MAALRELLALVPQNDIGAMGQRDRRKRELHNCAEEPVVPKKVPAPAPAAGAEQAQQSAPAKVRQRAGSAAPERASAEGARAGRSARRKEAAANSGVAGGTAGLSGRVAATGGSSSGGSSSSTSETEPRAERRAERAAGSSSSRLRAGPAGRRRASGTRGGTASGTRGAGSSGQAPGATPADDADKAGARGEARRETAEQRRQVMRRLEPVQELLMLGFIPDEADLSVWDGFATLTNGKVEIRASRVERVIGEYALGRGLFACQDFAMNEIITIYGGELVTTEEAKLRKDRVGSQSRRYLMRISDSDFLVDGWHYASGIAEKPGRDGIFLPVDKHAVQYNSGPGPMANHDSGLGANASVSFVPLSRAEAQQLLPRVPTLRAIRPIKKGEEIRFNYGSSLPFCPRAAPSAEEHKEVTEEVEHFALSRYWSDIEWTSLGLDAGVLRAELAQLKGYVAEKGKYKEVLDAASRCVKLLAPINRAAEVPQMCEVARLLSEVKKELDRQLRNIAQRVTKDSRSGVPQKQAQPLIKVKEKMTALREQVRKRLEHPNIASVLEKARDKGGDASAPPSLCAEEARPKEEPRPRPRRQIAPAQQRNPPPQGTKGDVERGGAERDVPATAAAPAPAGGSNAADEGGGPRARGVLSDTCAAMAPRSMRRLLRAQEIWRPEGEAVQPSRARTKREESAHDAPREPDEPQACVPSAEHSPSRTRDTGVAEAASAPEDPSPDHSVRADDAGVSEPPDVGPGPPTLPAMNGLDGGAMHACSGSGVEAHPEQANSPRSSPRRRGALATVDGEVRDAKRRRCGGAGEAPAERPA